MMRPFLNTRDLAVILDMSPDDVNAMARTNKIKGYKIGKRWRFRSRDVMQYLDSNQAEE